MSYNPRAGVRTRIRVVYFSPNRATRSDDPPPVFHPEFGRFMLEATPGKPWNIDLKELLKVEKDMKLR